MSWPVLSPPPHSQLTGAEITTCPPDHVLSCLQKLHLEMMMKHIVLACTVPTTPLPANRGRNYYLPPWKCPLLFAEAGFGNGDEKNCPGLYCPRHYIPCQQGQKLLPVFAEAAFGNDDETHCPGLSTTCILSRHSGKADLSLWDSL